MNAATDTAPTAADIAGSWITGGTPVSLSGAPVQSLPGGQDYPASLTYSAAVAAGVGAKEAAAGAKGLADRIRAGAAETDPALAAAVQGLAGAGSHHHLVTVESLGPDHVVPGLTDPSKAGAVEHLMQHSGGDHAHTDPKAHGFKPDPNASKPGVPIKDTAEEKLHGFKKNPDILTGNPEDIKDTGPINPTHNLPNGPAGGGRGRA